MIWTYISSCSSSDIRDVTSASKQRSTAESLEAEVEDKDLEKSYSSQFVTINTVECGTEETCLDDFLCVHNREHFFRKPFF